MTLFNQLLSFSKDGETFSLEDLAEHHHLRHNQSRAESPHWQFGNSDATCALLELPSRIVSNDLTNSFPELNTQTLSVYLVAMANMGCRHFMWKMSRRSTYKKIFR